MKLGIANNMVGRAVERRQVLSDIGDVPTAGYSVRKLTAGYTGPCVKVRRFDGAEQDFGFLGEDLDTTSLLRFVKNEDAPLPVDRGDAVGAYSVRKVSSTYTGSVVKVRRTVSAVTVEADVAFDDADTISLNSAVTITSGTSSAATLGEFVANAGYTDVDSLGGAQDAFVAVWYDQSGGGNDASQSTAGSQPKIVSSGALVTENGKVALDFDGGDSLVTANFTVTSPTTVSIVAESTTQAVCYYFDGRLVNNRLGIHSLTNNASYRLFSTSDSNTVNLVDSTSKSTSGNQINLFAVKNSSSSKLYENGTEIGSGTLTTDSFVGLTIGARYALNSNYVDKMQELVFWEADKSSTRASIEDEINQYYSIYTEAVKDGFVTTWYDQSGSGYHATQATAASQPKIVSAGTLVTENGKVALDFDGSDDKLINTASLTQPFTALSVYKATASISFPFGSASTNLNGAVMGRRSNDQYIVFAGSVLSSGVHPLTTVLAFGLFNGASSSGYWNGSLILSGNAGPNTDVTAIGANGADEFTGTIQEVLFFNTDKSSLRTAIEDNINAYFNIY